VLANSVSSNTKVVSSIEMLWHTEWIPDEVRELYLNKHVNNSNISPCVTVNSGYMPSGETYAADCATLREMVKNAYSSSAVPKVVCGDWSCEDEPNDVDQPNPKTSVDQWWKMVDDFNNAATTLCDGDPHGSVDALSMHWYLVCVEYFWSVILMGSLLLSYCR